MSALDGPWYSKREREWAMYVDGKPLCDELGQVRYFLTAQLARDAVADVTADRSHDVPRDSSQDVTTARRDC